MRTFARTATYAAMFLAAGCDTPVEPDDTEVVVALVSPVDGIVVPQNDASIGCEYHPDRGYGFRLTLDWEDAHHATNGQRYEIWVQHSGSAHPLAETFTSGSRYTHLACNAFVIDRNLEDWEWKVRAVRGDGGAGPWSEVRTFRFAPCRLESGVPCNAPPAPPPAS